MGNLQVRFLEGWAPAMAPGHSTVRAEQRVEELNPLLRGWGEYYKRAHIRKLFQRLDGWVRRRIWSHRYKRWRNAGWKQLPATQLYGEYELVRLIDLIPSLASRHC
jgi:RNA-directed DNA polymerase